MARWAREAYPEVEAAFSRTRASIEQDMGEVEETLARARPDPACGRDLRPGTDAAPGGGPPREGDAGPEEAGPGARVAAAPHPRRPLPRRLVSGARPRPSRRAGPTRPRPRRRAAATSGSLRARPPGGAAMRLGIVCYPTVGGSGAVAAELGKQLAGRGHEVHVISYKLPFRFGDFHQNICFHEVDVSSYPLFDYPPHVLALAAKMAEAVREHGIELFHVHYAIPHAIAGFLAQQMLGKDAPRMVTTLHGTDITIVGQDHSFFEITRFGIERSDEVTAVSEFLRRMTVDEFEIDRPIEVIPNFVDLEQYPVDPGRPLVHRPAGTEGHAPRLQLPPGQADPRHGEDLRAGHPGDRRGPAHGGRGSRAILGPGPGPPARGPRPHPLPRHAPGHRGDRGDGRRLPAPVRARVLRALRSRGHGLRRPRRRLRRRGPPRGRPPRRERVSASRGRRRGHVQPRRSRS